VTPPVALTIAGSDSGGGAGVQADLKTFAARGVFGASAITALTAQNTAAVLDARPVDAAFVAAQVEAVLADLPVAAVKTGLLGQAAIVEVVADLAAAGRLPNLVVDPVMVASSGARLLDRDAEQRYLDQLFPTATVVTPNVREAAALLGRPIRTLAEQRDAGEALAAYGPRVVVVTGGDALDDDRAVAVDTVWGVDGLDELAAPRLPTRNTHGSGCSFAAATAAALARGQPLADALRDAKTYVHDAIRAASCWHLGSGHGPLNHFLWEETS
jgi:hydroxymethylpyrimidine/phosphomethylpyrimidine kinase